MERRDSKKAVHHIMKQAVLLLDTITKMAHKLHGCGKLQHRNVNRICLV